MKRGREEGREEGGEKREEERGGGGGIEREDLKNYPIMCDVSGSALDPSPAAITSA
jgi:hypothetical protein